MTFALVRVGLPNTAVALALAAVPFVALMLASVAPAPLATSPTPATSVVAGVAANDASNRPLPQ
jgi:hypothetical protein